jgi:hypothetical protein
MEYRPKIRDLEVDGKSVKFRENPPLEGNMGDKSGRRGSDDAGKEVVEWGPDAPLGDSETDDTVDYRNHLILSGIDPNLGMVQYGRDLIYTEHAGPEEIPSRSSTPGYTSYEKQVFKQQRYEQGLMPRASPNEGLGGSETSPSPPEHFSGITNRFISMNKDGSKSDLVLFKKQSDPFKFVCPTISRDNTTGEHARKSELLAELGKRLQRVTFETEHEVHQDSFERDGTPQELDQQQHPQQSMNPNLAQQIRQQAFIFYREWLPALQDKHFGRPPIDADHALRAQCQANAQATVLRIRRAQMAQ